MGRVFESSFFPRAGVEAIHQSYANYCAGINGSYREGLCSYNNEKAAHFYVRTSTVGMVKGTPEILLRVYEASPKSSSEILALASRQGYVTVAQANERARAQELSEKRRLLAAENMQREQRKAAQAELRRRQSLSRSTASLVRQKGSRVCYVESTDCDNSLCFVEDYNPKNDKVKVSIFGKAVAWMKVSTFFACERS